MHGYIIEASDANFDQEVFTANLPVLVDFWAPWCGPCKMLAPVLEDIAKTYAGKLKVVKVNVDENRTSAAKFRVMSIPTLILFKDGNPVQQIIGFRSQAELKEVIDKVLST